MSSDNETLDDRVYEIAKLCAEIKAGQVSLHERLFVEGGGVIPTMQAAIACKADAAEFNRFKEKSTWRAGYTSGLTTAGMFIVKWGASKLGIHL